MSQLNIHAQSLHENNHCLTCQCLDIHVYSTVKRLSTDLIQALLGRDLNKPELASFELRNTKRIRDPLALLYVHT